MNTQNNEQTRLLKEILKWIKFAGMKEVKEVLNSVLDTDQKKLVYQLSDGSKGMIEVGKAAGIASTATISKYWKSWLKLGLGENVSVKGGERFRRAFDLEDFGIEVPQLEKAKVGKEGAETPSEVTPEGELVQEETREEKKT
jgi:hypothetical protein